MELKLKPLELVAISISLALSSLLNRANAVPQVPCYFIFGDSLSDNGNNNNLPTFSKVNYLPYGIDFPRGPTGRFSNGRNAQDFIVELLGFQAHQYMPPFTQSKGRNITNGVNYVSRPAGPRPRDLTHVRRKGPKRFLAPHWACLEDQTWPDHESLEDGPMDFTMSRDSNYASGSAGILKETGKNTGATISFDQQIFNHKIIISELRSSMRNKSATNSLLNKCIYSIRIGNNDYINNYFMPKSYDTSRRFTPLEYAITLIQQLSDQLKFSFSRLYLVHIQTHFSYIEITILTFRKMQQCFINKFLDQVTYTYQRLYDTGARKFAVYGVEPIGCTRFAISKYGTNGSLCVDRLNKAATLFNDRLRPLIDQLNNNLTDAKFTYLHPTGTAADLAPFVTNSSCCIIERRGGQLCLRNSQPCGRPKRYVFWDALHPTEAWNEIVATSAYDSDSPLQASPFNIRRLATL
ncbi:hypothetical protein GQ457_08G022500 [Hibiscus cannabinus]